MYVDDVFTPPVGTEACGRMLSCKAKDGEMIDDSPVPSMIELNVEAGVAYFKVTLATSMWFEDRDSRSNVFPDTVGTS